MASLTPNYYLSAFNDGFCFFVFFYFKTIFLITFFMQFTSFQKFVAFVLFCFLLFLAMVSSDQADLLSKSFPSLSVLLNVILQRATLSNMFFLPILFSPQDSGVVISNFLSHYVETVSFLFFFLF